MELRTLIQFWIAVELWIAIEQSSEVKLKLMGIANGCRTFVLTTLEIFKSKFDKRIVG